MDEEAKNAPSPLLKQRLTESNGPQRTLSGVPVSAATCQIRAPSKCVLTSFSRAYCDISITSSWGRIVPLRVFSKAITLVGAKCTSEPRTAHFSISARVRWCPLDVVHYFS